MNVCGGSARSSAAGWEVITQSGGCRETRNVPRRAVRPRTYRALDQLGNRSKITIKQLHGQVEGRDVGCAEAGMWVQRGVTVGGRQGPGPETGGDGAIGGPSSRQLLDLVLGPQTNVRGGFIGVQHGEDIGAPERTPGAQQPIWLVHCARAVGLATASRNRGERCRDGAQGRDWVVWAGDVMEPAPASPEVGTRVYTAP